MLQATQLSGFGSPDRCKTLKTAQFFYAPILPEGCLIDRSTGTTQSAVGDPVGRLVNFGTIGGFAAALTDAARGTKEINTRAGVRGTRVTADVGGYSQSFTEIDAPVVYMLIHARTPKSTDLLNYERIIAGAAPARNDYNSDRSFAISRDTTTTGWYSSRNGTSRTFGTALAHYQTNLIESVQSSASIQARLNEGANQTIDTTALNWPNFQVSVLSVLCGWVSNTTSTCSRSHLHAIAVWFLNAPPSEEFKAQARREMRNLCATPNCEVLASNDVWADFQDISNMWQDWARTIPVTASGQPVASVRNKGRLGGFFESVYDGTGRLTYQTSGGYGRLSTTIGDGGGQILRLVVPNFDPRQGSIAVIVNDTNTGNNFIGWTGGPASNNDRRQSMNIPFQSVNYMDANQDGASGRASVPNTALNGLTDFIMTVSDDPSVGSKMFKNNVEIISNTTVANEAAPFSTFVIVPVAGSEFYSAVGSRKTWTAQERASIRAALRAQVGI